MAALENNLDDDDWFEAWEEPSVHHSCALLRQNDPSTKVVIVTDTHAQQICSALQGNTEVEKLLVDFRWTPGSVYGSLNRYISTSPSLKEFEFDTANGSESLGVRSDTLPLVNLLLFSTCGKSPVETLTNVPLCQTTAPSFSNTLRINDKLRGLAIDFPCEPTEEDEDEEEEDEEEEVLNLVRTSMAPDVAQALSSTNVESLSLNWMEHEHFVLGEAFFTALPGCLPASLQQLELSNFVDTDAIAGAISDMIEQSGAKLNSILLSFCKFGDDNFHRILDALKGSKPDIKVLHYGFLHSGTAPVLAQSVTGFGRLEELGAGFHEDIEAFEVFCEELPYNETLNTLDIQLNNLSEIPRLESFLRALAVAIVKLPNLCSITSVFTYYSPPVVEDTPVEFLAALDAHKHLVNFIPRIRFENELVEYYLMRNRFRDQLVATKPSIVEALKTLSVDDNPIPLTLVKNTLRDRDDLFQPGVDHGKALPLPAEERPTFRRFRNSQGPLF